VSTPSVNGVTIELQSAYIITHSEAIHRMKGWGITNARLTFNGKGALIAPVLTFRDKCCTTIEVLRYIWLTPGGR
jgi:hypothetical protein